MPEIWQSACRTGFSDSQIVSDERRQRLRTHAASMCAAAAIGGASRLTRADQTTVRGSQVCVRVVPELGDERMVVERVLDDAPLNAPPAPVDESELSQAGFVCGAHVLLDDRRNVTRREGVQIEFGFDWDAHQALSPKP